MNFEKNDNSNKIVFNKWFNSYSLEENTKPIIFKKNEYSSMSYHMWLGTKNYLETSSNNNNDIKAKIINNKFKIKNNVEIYSLIFNKIFDLPKIHIINMNLNINLINLKKILSLATKSLIY